MLQVSSEFVDVDDVTRVASKVSALYRFNKDMKADTNDLYDYIKKLKDMGLIENDVMKKINEL